LRLYQYFLIKFIGFNKVFTIQSKQMKKRIITIVCIGMCLLNCKAQYESVVFDYSMSYFNNGQPLPSEKKIMFNGRTLDGAEMVKIALFKPGGKKPLYEAKWRKNPGEDSDVYNVPFNYRLQAGREYDITIKQYKKLSSAELAKLESTLQEALHFLVEETIVKEDDEIELAVSESKFYNNLNQAVYDILDWYEVGSEWEFEGFSEATRIYINQIEKEFDVQKRDTTAKSTIALDSYYQNKVSKLKQLLNREIQPVLDQQLFTTQEIDRVKDYPTEEIRGSLALNVGYGGVFLEGEVDDFSYDAAPYIGLSFPLSRRIYTAPFLNNVSISLGAFVSNFEDELGNEITGPIFGRPYFLGLGYRLFRFIRINVGATALEEKGSSTVNGGSVSIETSDVQIRPFVGISAEINLSVGSRRE